MTLREQFDAEINQMSMDDLPSEDLKLVAEAMGLDTLIGLIKSIPGITLYIPGRSGLLKVVERFVMAHQGQVTNRELAMICGTTVRQIQRIIEQGRHPAEATGPCGEEEHASVGG